MVRLTWPAPKSHTRQYGVRRQKSCLWRDCRRRFGRARSAPDRRNTRPVLHPLACGGSVTTPCRLRRSAPDQSGVALTPRLRGLSLPPHSTLASCYLWSFCSAHTLNTYQRDSICQPDGNKTTQNTCPRHAGDSVAQTSAASPATTLDCRERLGHCACIHCASRSLPWKANDETSCVGSVRRTANRARKALRCRPAGLHASRGISRKLR
jgi:hypothetical protein